MPSMSFSPTTSGGLHQCVRTRLCDFLKQTPLKDWIESRAPSMFEPFYSSIDIRDAGYKLAPVDANLYPAGFNNICSEDLENAGEVIKPMMKRHLDFFPERIAILPEAHTKNKFYVDNIIELRHLFKRMGVVVEIGWIEENSNAPVKLESASGKEVTAYPFERKGKRLILMTETGEFDPQFILVNNDFSSGFPALLEGIEQPIEPSPRMGWHSRKKSDFFIHYNALVADLAKEIGVDPWCLSVDTRLVSDVDFDENSGIERIAAAVDDLIASITEQYQKRGIAEKPFVFIKSNAGTYGMGIMKVESGAELLSLNRRERNKMAVVKNKLEVHEVIVQEGVPTRFQFEGTFAEPAVYLFGKELVGGFLRKNPTRGRTENLNSKGMVFQKLCMSDLRNNADRDMELEMVYGTIAQLSAAAMSLEQKAKWEHIKK